MRGSLESGKDIPVLIKYNNNRESLNNVCLIFSQTEKDVCTTSCVPYGDILVEVGGDVADEASHEHQDHAATAIECHHHTDLGHSPVN